jgi:uncharacterized Tic20 family protein
VTISEGSGPHDASGQVPSNPPPGWYPDHTGRIVWWDGYRWTVPLAQNQGQPDRTWAILSHLSHLALAVVAPIIIRVTAGKTDPFVRHHATEALNAQITFVIVWFATIFTMIGTTVATTATDDMADPPWGVFLLFAFAFVVFGAMLAFSIRGAVQASRRIWWRYPISIRFVGGAVKR